MLEVFLLRVNLKPCRSRVAVCRPAPLQSQVGVTGSPAATQHNFALKSGGSGVFFVDVIVICGVLVQGSVEIHRPHEKLALWERWEPGPHPPFAIKRKKSASHM